MFMRKDRLLVVLNVAGSALCWWPFILLQTPDNSHVWWLTYAFIALLTGVSTILSGGRWLRFPFASAAGTFTGLFVGNSIWPDKDGIAQSYALFGIVIATLITVCVSLVAGLVGRMLSAR
jgi:hypothetical protein